MASDLFAALCLVLVIEGLMLFVAPRGWQRMMQEASNIDARSLRIVGAIAIVVGLITLQFVY